MEANTVDIFGKPRFAVIGAGHGGTAMAAHLSLMGFDVSLYNHKQARLLPIIAAGGIELITDDPDRTPSGFAPLNVVTSDIAEAIRGREILMVVVPACAHRDIALAMAPYITSGQIVVLNPGRTGGALEVHRIFHDHGAPADVLVAESQTFLYASRAINPAQTRIFRVKNSIPVAAIPAYKTPQVVHALRMAFPQFVPGDNVMKTSLDNIGAIFHPAVTVLNSARIESTAGDFDYYTEGITPSTALVLEKMDSERVRVAEELGFRAISAREWLYIAYDAAGRNLYEAMRANRGYDGIKAPKTLFTRYLTEDVPMSLVPIASIGDQLEVPCPTIKAIVHLANVLHECDYFATGRNSQSMGLSGLSLQAIRRLVLEGLWPEAPVHAAISLED